jgi:hypothetical protein
MCKGLLMCKGRGVSLRTCEGLPKVLMRGRGDLFGPRMYVKGDQ